MIEVRDVSLVIQDRAIVDGVSIDVPEGQFTALVGGNGAGKTTLIRLIKGIVVPSAGQIVVDGTSSLGAPRDFALRIGVVFQNPETQIVASVVDEDVAFGPENLGLPTAEIARRVERSLKLVGLWDLRHRPVHALSGGQKQRLAIAGILGLHPKYILFDEATALLDPAGKREVLDTALTLVREGIGVLWVTHDLREVFGAHKLYAMMNGRVVFQGSPAEFLSSSSSLKAARVLVPDEARLAQFLENKGVAVEWPITRQRVLERIKSLSLKTSS
ncbi:ATP-binding cassette domain-containing protein [Coprothermobacteraceae bacterium]|nr:ATP-binding cassette domain-containing protein [Coprothermobacteraceae bacterium]